MNERGDGMSVDKRLDLHSERLNSHDKRDEEKHKRIKSIEENFTRLESTVTSQNQETRRTMTEQTGKLFVLVEKAMGYQDSQSGQQHELNIVKANMWSTVFLKVSED